MAFLEISNVSKGFGPEGNRTEVLSNINLSVEEGEFIAIVGFSGTGKTTLISMIAGLMSPDEGEIRLNGKLIEGPGPDRGVVFQNYSLLPWLTVYGNVSLAVNEVFPTATKKEKDERIRHYVDMVSLSHAITKYPAELSGGMRQRVSVARALAMDPRVLLLDEPLSALDALTRGTLQTEIENIWSKDKKTVILITNDVDEGILLADRIIPLKPGTTSTLGPSFEVSLDRPRDRTAINNNMDFKNIRNKVTKYLLSSNKELRNDRPVAEYILPDLKPLDLTRGRSLI